MAALTYKDDHNKVAYLEKSKGSEEYHQILDFLNGSTLRFIQMILGIQTTDPTPKAIGVGLLLWGDLKVLIDSLEGGEGYSIWGSQQNWQVRSWRLYTFSNVHVLETMTGKVLYMFVDVPYPLSVKLMERMFKHKLELARDVVGNDLTTAEQLIRFIKGKLAATQGSAAN
ncbi:hypothetical protein Tco_0040003 [Tanacetum coccineum]